MKTKRHMTGLTATLAILLTALSSCAVESVVTPAMVGRWEGNARIIVSWCKQKDLPVKVDIHADGSVTGTVGDAKLTEGRIQPNRGWLSRKLYLWSDYLIGGRLEGAIVAAEGITRSEVMMPLDVEGKTFTGGINTNGTKLAGEKNWKEKMSFSARSLTLTRPQ